MNYEEMDVMAIWNDCEDSIEEHVGEIQLQPEAMPNELEINGVIYKAQF